MPQRHYMKRQSSKYGEPENKTVYTKPVLRSLEQDYIIAASSGSNIFILDLDLAIFPSPELPLPLCQAKRIALSTTDDRHLLNQPISFKRMQ